MRHELKLLKVNSRAETSEWRLSRSYLTQIDLLEKILEQILLETLMFVLAGIVRRCSGEGTVREGDPGERYLMVESQRQVDKYRRLGSVYVLKF